jgi:transcriptional regulator with XRE-family HTH domain
MNKNWTEQNIENFLSRITFDFITQLEKKMESLPITQAELAKKLKLSESRVSQILNGSHNLELKSIIKYARALGLKIAVVAYDDNDPDNTRGLINSEIFSICWERQEKPVDFFAFEESTPKSNVAISPKFATEPITQPEKGHYAQSYLTAVESAQTNNDTTSNTSAGVSTGIENKSGFYKQKAMAA